MDKVFKVFVINPGSTSTRVGYFENEKEVYGTKLQHSDAEIAQFKEINDQFEMRRQMVFAYIEKMGITELDAIASRGGGGRTLRSGGYEITPLMVEECKRAPWPHASNLGCMIGYELMKKFSIPGYIYDSPCSDDFVEFAKLSGLPEFPRLRGAGHPLNEKSAGNKIAKTMGGTLRDFNFVIAHLGGGITVNAYQKGKIIDSMIDAFSPQRSGALPMVAFTKACFSGQWTFDEIFKKQMGGGGLVAYLGTSDILEIEQRIANGDTEAGFYFDAMIYQIAKDIGAVATTMNGQVDRVILTGEIAHSKRLVNGLAERVGFIAPVVVVPGAYEMEALAEGILRILRGDEIPRDYDTEQA